MKKKYTRKPTLAHLCYRNNKEGYYVARVPVLRITNYGKTPSEALHKLAEMEADTLAFDREHGNRVPTYEESLDARNALRRGGARKAAGRKPLEGGRVVIQVSASAPEYAAFKKAAGTQPVAAWVKAVLKRRIAVVA